MSGISGALRSNVAYIFLAAGVAWLAVAFTIGSYLVLWPALTCLLSGVLLRARPGERLTWAWATSSAVLGLVLSGYQAYAAVPLVGGPFSTTASISLAGFSVFAFFHLVLLYAGGSGGTRPT